MDQDDDYLDFDCFLDNPVNNKYQEKDDEELHLPLKRLKIDDTPQQSLNESTRSFCKKCNTYDSMVLISFEKICNNCGNVFERNDLDAGPEWSNYDNSVRNYTNPRCAQAINPFLPNMSMTTRLNCHGNRRLAYTLHVAMQKWNTPYHESAKYHVFTKTRMICERAGFLKKVIQDTITLLNTVIDHKELCGKIRIDNGSLCDKHEKLYKKKMELKVLYEKQKTMISKRSNDELDDELERLKDARDGTLNILPRACNVASSVFGRGECRDSVIAACVFHACILNNAERTEEEIASIFKLDTGKMTTGFQQFKNIMRLNRTYRKSMENVNQQLHVNYINMFSQKLKFTYEQQNIVKAIYDQVIGEGILDGRTPQTLTSTCFYVAMCIMNTSDKVSETSILNRVAKECDVSKHTIKSTSEIVFTYISAKLLSSTPSKP